MSTDTAIAPEEDAPSAATRRLVIAGLMLALILPAFDLLIVATAGKDIAADIGSLSQVSWMFIAYQLTLVASMPLFGKLGDLYGRKICMQSSIVLFVASSLFAGIAVNYPMFIAGRAVQGIAGGGIVGLTQAVIADLVSPRERGRYAWVTPTVWTVSAMLGPLVGGFFVDKLSWRWIFFINGPAGALAFIVLGTSFKVPVKRSRHQLDYTGATLLVVWVAALAFAVSVGGEELPWSSPWIIVSAAVGVSLAVLFVRHELHVEEPVFPLTLFANRVVRVCTISTFFVGAANFGLAIFLPLFLQVVSGRSATSAGLALMPISLGITISSTLVGRQVTRTGKYRWYPVIGCTVFTAGMILVSQIGVDSSTARIWSATFLCGFGSGMASPIFVLATQNAVRHEDVGVASSLVMFSRTIGQVFGPALAGLVWVTQFESNLTRLSADGDLAGYDVDKLRSDTKLIRSLPDPLHSAVVEALRSAISNAFVLAALFAVGAVVAAAFMRTVPLRDKIHGDVPMMVD
jgi:EmrB/QacA subfamily drug resistance transporter